MLSPIQSPSSELFQVILIADEEWAERFNQAMSSKDLQDGKGNLHIVRDDEMNASSELENAVDNTFVGIILDHGLEDVAAKYPRLRFFDYQATLSQDHQSCQVSLFKQTLSKKFGILIDLWSVTLHCSRQKHKDYPGDQSGPQFHACANPGPYRIGLSHVSRSPTELPHPCGCRC